MAKLHSYFRRKSISEIMQSFDKSESEGFGMKRNLRLWDLTSLGIAAIIGAGIFSTIGNAASLGGPAVSLLFVFTALACGLSALCYARFASQIPISGSAYTYAYASFGELVAWIIGWDLIMEYAVGNIAVAISWSDYFTGLMQGLGIHVPDCFSTDYVTAFRGYTQAEELLKQGTHFDALSASLQSSWHAFAEAPRIGSIPIIADIPAFMIVALITWLVYRGIRESKIAGNMMVLLKLAILFLVITVGAFYVNPENWNPFAPNGIGGVLKGVAGVFFAYIGFDAISTTAEECKNPKRDLPRAMFLSLGITTVLYVLICLVLTGMIHYTNLAVGDPLAYAFQELGLSRLSGIIAISAVIAMAGVLLVFQVGQPRIWMSMSRDGLLPPRFSKLHPRFKTPGFSTILTGVLVAIPSLFLNLTEVTDLTSIGTLFAFILVSGGVLILDKPGKKNPNDKGFHIPYVSSRYVLPILWMITLAILLIYQKDGLINFFDFKKRNWIETGFWELFKHKIPMFIFIIASALLTFRAVQKKLSLIPVLGLLTNFYLMTELGIINWLRFFIWLLIGLLIYFFYGFSHSKLARKL